MTRALLAAALVLAAGPLAAQEAITRPAAEALAALAAESLAEGDTLGAAASLQAALAGEWASPDALLTLGRLRLARGETGAAVHALERAARLAPADAEVGAARREAYARAGQVPPAVPAPLVAARTASTRVGAGLLVALGLALYLGAATLGFAWWRRRRDGEPTYRAMGWSAAALAPLALVAVVLAGIALWDAGRPRAVVLDGVDLHARPTPEAQPVGSVREGEVVRVREASGPWRLVDLGEVEGWAPARAVAGL